MRDTEGQEEQVAKEARARRSKGQEEHRGAGRTMGKRSKGH